MIFYELLLPAVIAAKHLLLSGFLINK